MYTTDTSTNDTFTIIKQNLSESTWKRLLTKLILLLYYFNSCKVIIFLKLKLNKQEKFINVVLLNRSKVS